MSKATAAARADIATVAAIQAVSPQSQLANQPINKQAATPQGDTALFVLADVRGKDAAVSYRLSVIRTAVLECMKGNPRNLKEAIATTATLGTSAKAVGYAAGFAVLADVSAIERVAPKWMDAANAGIRTQADTLADALTQQFNSAYMAAVEAKAAKAKQTRETNKAAKEAAAAALAAAQPAPAPAPAAEPAAEPAAVEVVVADVVAAAVNAINAGLLDSAELSALRAALAAADTPAVPVDLLLTAELPMTMQAH